MTKMMIVLAALAVSLIGSNAAVAHDEYMMRTYPSGATKETRAEACRDTVAGIRKNMAEVEARLGLRAHTLTVQGKYARHMECTGGRGPRSDGACYMEYACDIMMKADVHGVEFKTLKTAKRKGDARAKACADDLATAQTAHNMVYSEVVEYRAVLDVLGPKLCRVEGVEVLQDHE
jgi:hypothetical protein